MSSLSRSHTKHNYRFGNLFARSISGDTVLQSRHLNNSFKPIYRKRAIVVIRQLFINNERARELFATKTAINIFFFMSIVLPIIVPHAKLFFKKKKISHESRITIQRPPRGPFYYSHAQHRAPGKIKYYTHIIALLSYCSVMTRVQRCILHSLFLSFSLSLSLFLSLLFV